MLSSWSEPYVAAQRRWRRSSELVRTAPKSLANRWDRGGAGRETVFGLQSFDGALARAGVFSCEQVLWHCSFYNMSNIWSSSVDAVAFSAGAFREEPRLPWESGRQGGTAASLPFGRLGVAQCFSGPARTKGVGSFRWCPFPTLPFTGAQGQKEPAPAKGSASQPWLKVHRCGVMWPAMQDQEKSDVVELWRLLISSAGLATKLGRQLAATDDQQLIRETLFDTFAGKAASTVRSRASALLAFSRWRNVGAVSHVPVVPATEELVYKYFCQLRAGGAPASRAARCLQAFGFAKGTVGADVSDILESARVKGVCGQGERFVAKKAPLSMQQVVQLEQMAMEEPSQQSVFAGYLCFLTHARLRFTDGQYLMAEPVLDENRNKGFLEASVQTCRLS